MIPRFLKKELFKRLTEHRHKIIVLYGPRQVGKTTLVRETLKELKLKILEIDGGQKKYHSLFGSQDLNTLKSATSGYDLLFIDEAQKIPHIGENLKLLYDHEKQLHIIITGSSSLDLSDTLSEPLTGRKWTYTLFPISCIEVRSLYTNDFELRQTIEERLIWGSYPEIFSFQGNAERKKYLTELTDDYLYRDILELTDIKHADKIHDLLKLIAFQIGSPVSLSELGSQLGMSKNTVMRYIDLLEKSFVIFRLGGFSGNLRKEITKNNKIYFFDLGVRNILIDNVNPLLHRNDAGQLWENFLIIERMKRNEYLQHLTSSYFWRTYTGAEIDYVESSGGVLRGFEFKFNNKTAKEPPSWKQAYPEARFTCVNKENFLSFILN